MDANMDDVPARTSDYQGSDEIDDDAFSVHSSDWATPPHERIANEADGFSHPPTSTLAGTNEGSEDDLPMSARTRRYNRRSHSRTTSPGLFVSEAEDEDDGDLYSVLSTGIDETPHPRSSPGLFVPEDAAAFIARGETTLNKPENVLRRLDGMEALKRARDIKAEIETNIAVLQPRDSTTSKRLDPDQDPEDQLIKTLRDEHNMSWADIASRLNEGRRERGEAATFTSSAVYSRFVRLSVSVPASIGEIGFHPKDYAHLREAMIASNLGQMAKGKKRVKNYENPKELEANMRKTLGDEEHEDLATPERSEQLMQAVAKVERNFWQLVADEMERDTSRMYSPAALADRYHAI